MAAYREVEPVLVALGLNKEEIIRFNKTLHTNVVAVLGNDTDAIIRVMSVTMEFFATLHEAGQRTNNIRLISDMEDTIAATRQVISHDQRTLMQRTQKFEQVQAYVMNALVNRMPP